MKSERRINQIHRNTEQNQQYESDTWNIDDLKEEKKPDVHLWPREAGWMRYDSFRLCPIFALETSLHVRIIKSFLWLRDDHRN